MIYAREKKKPQKNETILYEVEEFIYGKIDYVTDCPYKERGRYTNAINKVGDLGCNTCEWQISHNPRAMVVRCSHPKLDKDKEKLFKW